MLFIHFTPKKNLKRIKRMGIYPGKGEKGVFLHPLLQGEKTLSNQWNRPCRWDRGTARHDQEMAKIVVRIPDDEMIRFGDMGDSRFMEPITVAEYGRCLADWNPWRNTGTETLPDGDGESIYGDPYWTWFGHEVLYEKPIPPKWFVKIYDHTNTDERTKRYRRDRRAKECFGEEEAQAE